MVINCITHHFSLAQYGLCSTDARRNLFIFEWGVSSCDKEDVRYESAHQSKLLDDIQRLAYYILGFH